MDIDSIPRAQDAKRRHEAHEVPPTSPKRMCTLETTAIAPPPSPPSTTGRLRLVTLPRVIMAEILGPLTTSELTRLRSTGREFYGLIKVDTFLPTPTSPDQRPSLQIDPRNDQPVHWMYKHNLTQSSDPAKLYAPLGCFTPCTWLKSAAGANQIQSLNLHYGRSRSLSFSCSPDLDLAHMTSLRHLWMTGSLGSVNRLARSPPPNLESLTLCMPFLTEPFYAGNKDAKPDAAFANLFPSITRLQLIASESMVDTRIAPEIVDNLIHTMPNLKHLVIENMECSLHVLLCEIHSYRDSIANQLESLSIYARSSFLPSALDIIAKMSNLKNLSLHIGEPTGLSRVVVSSATVERFSATATIPLTPSFKFHLLMPNLRAYFGHNVSATRSPATQPEHIQGHIPVVQGKK